MRTPSGSACRPRRDVGSRPVRAGVIGGLIASIPVVGPLLGPPCLSCASITWAAAGGALLGVGGPAAAAAGGAILVAAWWISMRRAAREHGPEERSGISRRLALVLSAAALGTYGLIALVAAPLAREAVEQLARAFSHQPSVLPPSP